MNVPRATYSFSTSFWAVPETFSRATPCLSADRDVHRDQHRSGGVDRHRGRDPVERDAVEHRLHVGQRVDRDADLADLAGGALVVGVEAHLGRQVEGGREARLALGEQELEALVGRLGRAEAGVLADRPGPAPVHRRLDAARERVLAGEAEVALVVEVRDVLGRVEAVGREAGEGLELLPALAGLLERLGQRALLPAAAGLVQALQLLLLGADQLVELGLAVSACAVACRVAGHHALLGRTTGMMQAF